MITALLRQVSILIFLKKCDTIMTVIIGAVPKSKQPPVVVA